MSNFRKRADWKIKEKGRKKKKKGTATGLGAAAKIGLNAIFGESKSEAPKPGEDPALDMRRRVSLPKEKSKKSKLRNGLKKEKERGSKQS
jgi:hypothetical protein